MRRESPASLQRTASLALIALLLAASLGAQTADEAWRTVREEHVFPVAAGTAIRAVNPHGDLAVRTHRLPEVYLLVNWQHHADDPRGLRLESVEDAGELALVFAFETGADAGAPPAWSKRRADVTLVVPERAPTRFETGAGKLEVRGTWAPTEVRTTTGDVKLRIYGSTSVTTEHGDVLVQLRSARWTPGITIHSTTGAIRVELPQDTVVAALIETRGEVTSDYSMEVERVPPTRLKRFRVGGGEPPATSSSLELTSYSGPIQVVESSVTAEPVTTTTANEGKK